MSESSAQDKAQYERTKQSIVIHSPEVSTETRQLRRARERMVKKVLREETKKVMRRKMIKGGPAAFADPV
tara:strand:- start:1148 stop:1357 length:210 start_codon:yes stop_codon:yes gene_type:complete